MKKEMRKEILTYMEELAEEYECTLFIVRKEKKKKPDMVTVLFYHFPTIQIVTLIRFNLDKLDVTGWKNAARKALIDGLRRSGIEFPYYDPEHLSFRFREGS